MNKKFRVLIGQLNPFLGNIELNTNAVLTFYEEACAKKADYALLSELFLTGYAMKDVFLRPKFLDDVENSLSQLAEKCDKNTVLGIGLPILREGQIYNGYFYLQNGKIIQEILKTERPNYDVFDEKRWFSRGDYPDSIGAPRINTAICEDMWFESYGEAIAPSKPEFLFVVNASPYYRGKLPVRQEVAIARAKQLNCPVIYTHFVGCEDEMVFDGASFVAMPDGSIPVQLPQFEETTALVEFEHKQDLWQVSEPNCAEIVDDWEADYRAMVLALKEYANETGFKTAVLGLSGGIDSALVACIAADALGPKNVRTLMMPSQYTSQESLDDAAECAQKLGIEYDSVSISPAVDAIGNELEPIFGGDPEGLTAENIQPRLRALYLMAMSNKFGGLLLTTGNKSEVAVGYSTLYGDMAGGYNPLKDLYKMRVFETCRWRNRNHRSWMHGNSGEVIPPQIIQKPPTAELRPDQKDSDSLPEYAVLDVILEAMIDNDRSVDEIVEMGFERAVVLKVQRLVYIAEFKRYQAAPGVKLTKRHFGTDRRYPIMNGWRDC